MSHISFLKNSTVIFKAFMNHHLIQYLIHKKSLFWQKNHSKETISQVILSLTRKNLWLSFAIFFMSDIICQCCQPWAIAKLFGNHIRLTTNVFKKCHVAQINESKRVVKLHPNETLRKFDYGNIVHRWTTHPMFTIML